MAGIRPFDERALFMHFLRSQLRICLLTNDSPFQGDDARDICEDLLEAGLTTLLLKMTAPERTPGSLRAVSDVVNTLRSAGRYCFAVDDIILAQRLSCDGIFLSSPPKNIARVREVIGPNRFIGVGIATMEDLDHVLAYGTSPIVDFVGVGCHGSSGQGNPPLALHPEIAAAMTRELRPKPVFWLGPYGRNQLNHLPESFSDGLCVHDDEGSATLKDKIRAYHLGLASRLGPTPWSVGVPPPDHTFRFSHLNQEQLRGNSIPAL